MRIVLIVPYFGKFPENFQTVLNSCKYNDDLVDWIFYTDDKTKYNYPKNCKVNYCSFDEIKERIQKLYEFEIKINTPYKLCDYKPAYGHIFSEDIKDYDYWGHCDIDCIFGKLSNFINEKNLKYDRIMRLGHLCLYKNNEENNKRYMLPIENIFRYKEVYQNYNNCIFDECNVKNMICIDDIWDNYKFSRLYLDEIVANVYYKSNKFILLTQKEKTEYEKIYYKNSIFYWDEGKLFLLRENNGKLVKREFAYIHFMKRKMVLEGNTNAKKLKIVPNKFIEVHQIPDTIEKFKMEKKIYITNQFFKSRWNNLKVKIKQKRG